MHLNGPLSIQWWALCTEYLVLRDTTYASTRYSVGTLHIAYLPPFRRTRFKYCTECFGLIQDWVLRRAARMIWPQYGVLLITLAWYIGFAQKLESFRHTMRSVINGGIDYYYTVQSLNKVMASNVLKTAQPSFDFILRSMWSWKVRSNYSVLITRIGTQEQGVI